MSSSALQNDLDVRVTDPQKAGDSLNSYVSYKIVSKSSRNGFEKGETTVVRRYTDFVWLCDDLTRLFPGTIIPTLPEKQAVGRFTPEFVEGRRRALEKFLERIVAHPELGFSTSFARFLQAGDAQLNEAKEITKAAKTKITDKAKSWFQDTANSLSAAAGPKKSGEIEKSVQDIKIDDIATYMGVLEKQLDTVLKHSETIVKRSGESASAIFDFSQGLSALGQTEGDNIGRVLTEIGAAIEKFSFEATQHAEAELRELEEPVEEYTRYCVSVKAAIQRRQDKRHQYRSAVLDLELKEQAYNKVLGVPGKEKDAVAKQDAVEKAQFFSQTVKAEFDKITEQLIREFDTFKIQKSQDLRNILLKYALMQAEYNDKAQRFWASIVPTLQALSAGTTQSKPKPVVNDASESRFVNTPSSVTQPATTTTSATASEASNPFAEKPTEYEEI